MSTLGFIGAGNMAEAILGGVLRAGLYQPRDVTMSDPVETRLKYLQEKYNVNTTTSNDMVVNTCETVVLAIKPQMTSAVLSVIKAGSVQRFISILAGTPTIKLERFFTEKTRFVRAAPNTPLMSGQGITAICGGAYATQDDLAVAKKIFSAAGHVIEANEKQMDMIMAISGCGPAYFFLIFEALADAGVNIGLSRDLALQLAAHTAAGAAKMVIDTGRSPAVLKDMVTSPGGTTIAALKILEEKGVRAAMMNAIDAAMARTAELDK